MWTVSIQLNHYKGEITANIFTIGSDFVIILRGPGEHLGAVSLGEWYKKKSLEKNTSSSVSTITSYGHRDSKITESLAHSLSKELKKRVAVVGGIHIDNINKNQINEIIEKINPLAVKIIKMLSDD